MTHQPKFKPGDLVMHKEGDLVDSTARDMLGIITEIILTETHKAPSSPYHMYKIWTLETQAEYTIGGFFVDNTYRLVA